MAIEADRDLVSRRNVDVLGIGVAVRDIAVWLDAFPEPDRKYQARDLFEAGGGPVPTALVTLARLGRHVAFAGVVGDNDAGRFVADSLRQEHVDVSGVVFREGFTTPTSIIVVEHGRRTILECFQYDLPLRFEELEAKKLPFDRCRFFLADARLIEIQVRTASRVRERGGRVMLDCGHPRAGVDQLLPVTDIAFLSSTYPESLYGANYHPREFLIALHARLAADGPRIAGLTMGSEGCAVYTREDGYVRIAGHDVEAVDSTGAGDVFHGAFVHAYMNGESAASAAAFANAAAALKCTGMTGRSALPPERQIRKLAGR